MNAEIGLLPGLCEKLQRYPNAKLQGVADGAKENWRILGEVAEQLGREVKWVLDYFHALEHINDALRRYAGKDREQATWDIRYWSDVLRDDPKGVKKVLRALKYRASKSTGKKHEDILKEVNYVERHKHMMDYAELRKQNRPIGSGIQEAACKTLATQRLKGSGVSWLEPGGQAILTLRGLEQSDRTEDAWNVLRPEFRKHFDIDEDTERLKPQYKAAA